MKNNNKPIDLKDIPADRRLIEQLYRHNIIDYKTRDYAFNLVYPNHQWGLWIARLLATVGTALILSGIIYFFAFNWFQITPALKLASIQLSMVMCLIGATYYSLSRLSDQLLLLSASVLIGVFMAVFGQIYQTGADAYQLFMMWSLLIFGWVLLSRFAALWFVWLVITNLFTILWWNQVALPSVEMKYLIYVYSIILNGMCLLLRELLVKKGFSWLTPIWTRIILTYSLLVIMIIPVIQWIVKDYKVSISLTIAAGLGAVGHIIFYLMYRYWLSDLWTLAAIILSVCIIIETSVFILLEDIFKFGSVFLFLLAVLTLIIFSLAVIYLHKLAVKLEKAA